MLTTNCQPLNATARNVRCQRVKWLALSTLQMTWQGSQGALPIDQILPRPAKSGMEACLFLVLCLPQEACRVLLQAQANAPRLTLALLLFSQSAFFSSFALPLSSHHTYTQLIHRNIHHNVGTYEQRRRDAVQASGANAGCAKRCPARSKLFFAIAKLTSIALIVATQHQALIMY